MKLSYIPYVCIISNSFVYRTAPYHTSSRHRFCSSITLRVRKRYNNPVHMFQLSFLLFRIPFAAIPAPLLPLSALAPSFSFTTDRRVLSRLTCFLRVSASSSKSTKASGAPGPSLLSSESTRYRYARSLMMIFPALPHFCMHWIGLEGVFTFLSLSFAFSQVDLIFSLHFIHPLDYQ